MTNDELRDQLRPYLKTTDCGKVEAFLQLCTYIHGDVSLSLWGGWVDGWLCWALCARH
jgi:hypothetical protein